MRSITEAFGQTASPEFFYNLKTSCTKLVITETVFTASVSVSIWTERCPTYDWVTIQLSLNDGSCLSHMTKWTVATATVRYTTKVKYGCREALTGISLAISECKRIGWCQRDGAIRSHVSLWGAEWSSGTRAVAWQLGEARVKALIAISFSVSSLSC